jgi:hypothetical protein
MFTQRFVEGTHRKIRAVSVLAAFIIAAGFSLRLVAQQRALELTPFKENEVPNSLILIKPSDPKFDTILNGYFRGLSEVPTFQNMRPYMVLVQNDATVPAVAYTISWKLVYRDGSIKTVSSTSISWPSFWPIIWAGADGNFINPSGQASIPLRPGGIRLVSPIFNMGPPGDLEGMKFYGVGVFLSSSTNPAVCPVAEIEGAVYRGGTYSGPEGVQVWRLHTTARFAAHDEAVHVLHLLNSSEPLKSVDSTLDVENKRGLSEHGTDTMAMYIRARGAFAGEVMGALGSKEGLKILRRIASEWPNPGAFTILGKRYRHLYSSAAQTANAQ